MVGKCINKTKETIKTSSGAQWCFQFLSYTSVRIKGERKMLDFKAAIFDLDWTLLDSMRVWEKIDVDFLAKRHLTVPDKYAQEICSKSSVQFQHLTRSLMRRISSIMAFIKASTGTGLFRLR
jgi:hypothetical protein